jgi:hypothetical protein
MPAMEQIIRHLEEALSLAMDAATVASAEVRSSNHSVTKAILDGVVALNYAQNVVELHHGAVLANGGGR